MEVKLRERLAAEEDGGWEWNANSLLNEEEEEEEKNINKPKRWWSFLC